MTDHRVVSKDEWLNARKALLAKEKELSRLRDDLSKQRRELPWVKVTEPYVFDGPKGKETLADLFDGRSQLVVYHFMFSPDAKAGCPHCSFWADNFEPAIVHMNHDDVSMVAISRAPYEKIAAYRERMGWRFRWLSSFGTRFNHDYQVSFTPEEVAAGGAIYNFGTIVPGGTEREGASVFFKDESGAVLHTYSTYARGIDLLNTAYNYLDLVPKGRNEGGRPQHWVKRHDEY